MASYHEVHRRSLETDTRSLSSRSVSANLGDSTVDSNGTADRDADELTAVLSEGLAKAQNQMVAKFVDIKLRFVTPDKRPHIFDVFSNCSSS